MIKCNRLYREEGIISGIWNAFLAYNSYSWLVCTLDIKHMSIYLSRINVIFSQWIFTCCMLYLFLDALYGLL